MCSGASCLADPTAEAAVLQLAQAALPGHRGASPTVPRDPAAVVLASAPAARPALLAPARGARRGGRAAHGDGRSPDEAMVLNSSARTSARATTYDGARTPLRSIRASKGRFDPRPADPGTCSRSSTDPAQQRHRGRRKGDPAHPAGGRGRRARSSRRRPCAEGSGRTPSSSRSSRPPRRRGGDGE